MEQLKINCADSLNFYSYQYYLNSRNEYGEYQFDIETGRLLITKKELVALVSEEMHIPKSAVSIFDYSYIKKHK